MSALERHPRKVDSIVINDETEEPSLLNSATGQLLITNTVGKRIMELLDGTRSAEAVVETLAKEFPGVERSVLVNDTRDFLVQAAKKGLIA